MHTGVAIYAGFSTGSETQLSQRNPNLQAILSGDLEKDFSLGNPFASADLADNAVHVVTADRVNPAARLDGFLIKSGNASGSGTDGKGGGLWLFWGGGTIVRCTFQYNRATSSDRGGGAMHVDGAQSIFGGGTPRVSSCSFIENQAVHKGAALSMFEGLVDMANCVFRGNEVTTANTGLGGAIYKDSISECHLFNCTLFNNTAAIGPSAYLDGSGFDLDVRNSILWNSSTSSPVQSPIAGSTTDADVTYSIVEGGFTGTGNIDSNPFLNTSLAYDAIPPQYGSSPCTNRGNDSDLPADWGDVDGDSDTTEVLPRDRGGATRDIACVDMGALEDQFVPNSVCPADRAGGIGGGPDGMVDIDDLLFIINNWGVPGGAADSHTSPCGNGTVNIDDLLLVINSWGFNCATQQTENVGSLSSVEDCMEAATNEELEPFSEEWDNFVQKCVDGLCEAQIIVCD